MLPVTLAKALIAIKHNTQNSKHGLFISNLSRFQGNAGGEIASWNSRRVLHCELPKLQQKVASAAAYCFY
jgi:hypothetical protein